MSSVVPADSGRPRPRLVRRVLIGLVLLTLVAYAAAVVHLMMSETELIFRTSVARADTKPSFAYTKIDLPRSDGAAQFAWRIQHANDSAGDWVLFLHGNASTVASRMNVKHCARLHEMGFNVLAPEYRGYNGLSGVPTEASVAADARAAYDYLRASERVPPERIVIFGWSLGAAIAVDLASQVETRAVILEGAPDSIVEIGQQRYPLFPIRMIIRNPFNVIDRIGRVRAPLLFLHSPEHVVVPFVHGRKLFDAAPSPKTFVEVRGGHIEASETDRDVFYGAIASFLSLSATPLLSR